MASALGYTADKVITYSFGDYPSIGLHSPNYLQRQAVRDAMDQWEAVCGVRFVEVAAGDEELYIATADLSRYGLGPNVAGFMVPFVGVERRIGGDTATDAWVLLDDSYLLRNPNHFYDIVLHEIGHAMGLAHSDVEGAVMSGWSSGTHYIPSLSTPWREQLTYDRHPRCTVPVRRACIAAVGPADIRTGPRHRHRWCGHAAGAGRRDIVEAGGGDDLVDAGSGEDIVLAGAGDDTVYGRDGADWLYGEDGK